ncbi:ArsR/SmtB family transcription factor [Halovivax limisalsi]|uniref:ArsR/SmtB family transcription factor n=1 Tax=Halovivax limisalsi TaxID=1453760 RepID=UPI001FFCD952|nr:helix-turn-helix domain-containing protein [Halovivax limisalsi]
MARLFPLRSEAPSTDGTPRVVDLDDEDADAVFGALSSTTARRIYATLDEDPGTPSDVADAIDSSIQNVRYHLEKLEDAGLVEVVDTWYSSRGNEMSVYATANGPLIVTSDESRASQLKQAVSRYVGGVGVLAAASLFVQAAAERFTPTSTEDSVDGELVTVTGDGAAPRDDGGWEIAGADGEDSASGGSDDAADGGGDGGDGGGTDGADGERTEEADAADGADASADAARDGGDGEFLDSANTSVDDPSGAEPDGVVELLDAAVDGLFSAFSPGSLFFLGGLLVLTALLGWWYLRTYRPTAVDA